MIRCFLCVLISSTSVNRVPRCKQKQGNGWAEEPSPKHSTNPQNTFQAFSSFYSYIFKTVRPHWASKTLVFLFFCRGNKECWKCWSFWEKNSELQWHWQVQRSVRKRLVSILHEHRFTCWSDQEKILFIHKIYFWILSKNIIHNNNNMNPYENNLSIHIIFSPAWQHKNTPQGHNNSPVYSRYFREQHAVNYVFFCFIF